MKTYITYFVALLCLVGITSCRQDKGYRIGVSQCSDDDWRKKMNDEINREIMFHPEATVEIRSADDNNEKQIADLRYFEKNNFDIIVVSPNEAAAITPVISEIYKRGIPVVVFDRKVTGDDYTVFQGADNEQMGHEAALYGSKICGHQPRVLEIYGLMGSTPAIERHNGFTRTADSLGFNILASAHGDWTYEGAEATVDSLLNVHTDVDLIYAHNDRMAIAASDVARRRGLKLKVIGIDGAPEIGMRAVADSVIDATFIYPTEGYRLVRTALDILKKHETDRIVKLPTAPVVDRSNAELLLMQNDALGEETAKIRQLKTEIDEYWHEHSAQTALVYATMAILVLLCGVLFLVLRAFWTARRHREAMEEATQSKLTFFTNVSHDLRTPLTLIAGPVAELATATNLNERQTSMARIANKNVKILQRLINQILDFRKYENGKLALNLVEVNMARLVLDWTDSFQAVARSRDLHLSFNINLPADFTMAIDPEKIERVYFNLLSNAIKYTPANGDIHVDCSLVDNKLKLSVVDTGRGIANEDIDKIFDRFYQAEKVHPKGSGIGLSLAKAFVELHKGTLNVESTPGRGSEFTVVLPVEHVAAQAQPGVENLITQQDINDEIGAVDIAPMQVDTDKPLLLFIDDNDDMRNLVKSILSDSYCVITASNGKEGLHLAAKYVPDLIVCDVMMPVMDGFECCSKLKAEVSTSHIPVLLLTACSMDEQRADGYECGADGYLTKPFDSKVLMARCKSLIDNRRIIKNLWQNGADTAPKPERKAHEAAAATDPHALDNDFYARVLEILNRDLGDPDLNVDALASKMGLGRSQFYRKIKAITNYSPVELLRKLRLNRARTLITSTDKTISEIAYECGFSSPAYFTRCFREAFNETPGSLRDRLGS